MGNAVSTKSLDPILRGVSRSFFLSLRVAPRRTRRQLGLGYLFCRAADTIADTRLLPRGRRLELLRAFRAQFGRGARRAEAIRAVRDAVASGAASEAERRLLERLEECFAAYDGLAEADRKLLAKLVGTLTCGMEMDLEVFPPEESGEVRCLETDEDLDRYTYYVAGCVGEFWTELQVAHLPALRRWDLSEMVPKGIRFGKGLQMTNILRDVDRDLALGRCYFPRPRLEAACVALEDLKAGRDREKLLPVLDEYLALTLEEYRDGWAYTLAIPRAAPRLRLACAWPLLIGLATLALLARSPDPYRPGTALKISRKDVRRILVRSALRVFSNRALDRMYRRLESEIGTRA
ncbi:MAG: phytoene/squalene synthase family protein [Planctomycetota bacterium]